MTNTHSRVRNV